MKSNLLKKDFLICLLLLIIFIILPFIYPSRYFIGQITIFFIWTTVISQWNIVFGYAGIFSLAQRAGIALSLRGLSKLRSRDQDRFPAFKVSVWFPLA